MRPWKIKMPVKYSLFILMAVAFTAWGEAVDTSAPPVYVGFEGCAM
jgi:hypothetical protein